MASGSKGAPQPLFENGKRVDGRAPEQLRPIKFTRGYTRYAEGSVFVEFGETKVLCNATVEDRIPPWMRGSGVGWVTAEYSMLPRSTHDRSSRESERGKIGGRTHEIQRLIGRSLRAVTKREQLGEVQITLDCDVVQADGGTRTASIAGAFVALYDAVSYLVHEGRISAIPITDYCAAISVGIVEAVSMLDLCYLEDADADVDMNVVMTGGGRLIEVQGTAEGAPFTKREMDDLIGLAEWGIREIVEAQRSVLGLPESPPPDLDDPFSVQSALPSPPPAADRIARG